MAHLCIEATESLPHSGHKGNSYCTIVFRVTGHLGSGQFGNVERGTWQSKMGLEVALKTLKVNSTNEDKVKFLQEAAIMAQFRHPNVLFLHGVVSDKEPVSRATIYYTLIQWRF